MDETSTKSNQKDSKPDEESSINLDTTTYTLRSRKIYHNVSSSHQTLENVQSQDNLQHTSKDTSTQSSSNQERNEIQKNPVSSELIGKICTVNVICNFPFPLVETVRATLKTGSRTRPLLKNLQKWHFFTQT